LRQIACANGQCACARGRQKGERGSRDLLNRKSAMPKPPFQALPGGKEYSVPARPEAAWRAPAGRAAKKGSERTLLAEDGWRGRYSERDAK
jgi:hypothetical protein